MNILCFAQNFTHRNEVKLRHIKFIVCQKPERKNISCTHTYSNSFLLLLLLLISSFLVWKTFPLYLSGYRQYLNSIFCGYFSSILTSAATNKKTTTEHISVVQCHLSLGRMMHAQQLHSLKQNQIHYYLNHYYECTHALGS